MMTTTERVALMRTYLMMVIMDSKTTQLVHTNMSSANAPGCG